MFSCENEFGERMIERSRRPAGGTVARFACLRKIAADMVGIRRPLKIGLMALETIRVHQLIITVRMTILTLCVEMLPC